MQEVYPHSFPVNVSSSLGSEGSVERMGSCVHQETDPVTGTLVLLGDVLVELSAPWKYFPLHWHPVWSVTQLKWGYQLVGEGMQEHVNVLHVLLGSSCEGRMCCLEHLFLQYPVGHWTGDDCLHISMPV